LFICPTSGGTAGSCPNAGKSNETDQNAAAKNADFGLMVFSDVGVQLALRLEAMPDASSRKTISVPKLD
jgi:hypothetical protein